MLYCSQWPVNGVQWFSAFTSYRPTALPPYKLSTKFRRLCRLIYATMQPIVLADHCGASGSR
jgi:hypothetical protein